ncbi:unnamed protein product [Bursaphelenchus xylophilus]|uniref:(pine wood nematode) hypothetical protein n=1 Tax=Bursaphelenchus xylophilus TaxID=6326 RepID=A0A1I7SLB6_BURXY|nr:unnamed protein product [Bursaphelenchus xylophilus]CAG9129468.1 unnamed protein product [Bursaphelenchus xylophilus]
MFSKIALFFFALLAVIISNGQVEACRGGTPVDIWQTPYGNGYNYNQFYPPTDGFRLRRAYRDMIRQTTAVPAQTDTNTA